MRGADEIIGERIHQLMWRAQVSQTQFAPELGVGQAALSLKLRGRRGWSAADLIAVARYFDVSVGYLFGEGDDANGPKSLPTD